MKKLIFLIVCGLFLSFARAETQDFDAKIDQSRETELALKAKRRQYPGGRDESDLKVQAQLVQPTRKMTPTTEDEEPAEPASDD